MGYTHSSVQKPQHCRHDADSRTAAVYTKAGRKHKGGTDNTPKHSQPNIKQNANKTGADQPSHRGSGIQWLFTDSDFDYRL